MIRRAQEGNAVIFILLAIALFAALAYTFLSSSKSGMSNLTANQAKLLAQDIVSYAQSQERATAKLMQSRTCAETQLEYDASYTTDCGPNAEAPVDHSCSLFNAAGGKLTAVSFSSRLPSTTVTRVSGGSSLEDIGTWDSNNVETHQDIVLWVGPITKTLCMALNTLVGNNPEPPDVGAGAQNWCFNDDIGGGGNHFGGSLMALGSLAGKPAGCLNNTDVPMNDLHLDTGYQFYYVIYAR